MNTSQIGKYGEDLAVGFLKKHGYKILERNIHLSHNEIDVIAKKKGYLVFVEVKTRSTQNDLYSDFGVPSDAIDDRKISRTLRAATDYLAVAKAKYKQLQPRFDVIEVYLDKENGEVLKINHLPDAFGA